MRREFDSPYPHYLTDRSLGSLWLSAKTYGFLSLAAPSGTICAIMNIKPEYESQLVLRNVREFVESKRKFEECIPENMKEGREYGFLVDGQRNYWLFGEFPLYEIREDGKVSEDPRALINICEVTQFLEKGHVFTKGKYKILTVIGK